VRPAPNGASASSTPQDISITGDDGRVYTLQVARAQIVVSTGEVFELPENRVGAALDAFIAHNENRAPSIESGLQAAGYNMESRIFIDTPRLLTSPVIQLGSSRRTRLPETDSGIVQGSAQGDDIAKGRNPNRGHKRRVTWGVDVASVSPADLAASRGKARSPVGHWTMRRTSSRKRAAISPPATDGLVAATSRFSSTALANRALGPTPALSAMASDPACVDIARSIYDQTALWRSARDQWARQLMALLPAVKWDPLTGTMAIKRPEMENMINYDLAVDNLLDKQISLNYMAIQYYLNGCGNNLWPDNGQYASSGSGGGSGGVSDGGGLVCHPEMWEISYDGGNTWSPIQVSVCSFNQI
jgi:hypothetical protein